MTEPRIFSPATSKVNKWARMFSYRDRTLSNSIIEGWDNNTSMIFVELSGVTNVLIRNNHIRLSEPTRGGNFPFGVIVRSGSDVTVEDCTFDDFRMVPVDGNYENGDALCAERKAIRTTFRRCIVRNSSDGGIDTKGVDQEIHDCVFERNDRNIRLWGNGNLSGNISRDPRKEHIWLSLMAGQVYNIVDQQFFDSDGATHINLSKGGEGSIVNLVRPVVNGVPVTDASQLRIKKPKTSKAVINIDLTPKDDGQIVIAQQLPDKDGDGIIVLGSANQKIYKAKALRYIGPVKGGFAYKIER